jgi:hypothetical protein
MLLTSTVLYIAPQGRVAYWAGWTLFGLSRTQWIDIHVNLGILFFTVGALHIWYNWRSITFYLKNKSRRLVVMTRDFTVAIAVTAVLLVGTQAALPPFEWVHAGSEAFKDAAATRFGEPPYGHAELSSLATFTRRVELDLDDATARLVDAGYRAAGPQATLEEIAAANGITPQALYEAMRPEPDPSGAPSPMPARPRSGTGQRVLSELCAEYGLPVAEVVALLAEQGIEAAPEEELRDIASRAGTSPGEVYEAIRLGFGQGSGGR